MFLILITHLTLCSIPLGASGKIVPGIPSLKELAMDALNKHHNTAPHALPLELIEEVMVRAQKYEEWVRVSLDIEREYGEPFIVDDSLWARFSRTLRCIYPASRHNSVSIRGTDTFHVLPAGRFIFIHSLNSSKNIALEARTGLLTRLSDTPIHGRTIKDVRIRDTRDWVALVQDRGLDGLQLLHVSRNNHCLQAIPHSSPYPTFAQFDNTGEFFCAAINASIIGRQGFAHVWHIDHQNGNMSLHKIISRPPRADHDAFMHLLKYSDGVCRYVHAYRSAAYSEASDYAVLEYTIENDTLIEKQFFEQNKQNKEEIHGRIRAQDERRYQTYALPNEPRFNRLHGVCQRALMALLAGNDTFFHINLNIPDSAISNTGILAIATDDRIEVYHKPLLRATIDALKLRQEASQIAQ